MSIVIAPAGTPENPYPKNILTDPTKLPRTDATLYGPSISSGTTGYRGYNSGFYTAFAYGGNWATVTNADQYYTVVDLSGLTDANPVVMPWAMGPAVNSTNNITTFKITLDGTEYEFTVRGNRGFIGGGIQEEATAASVLIDGTNSTGYIFQGGYGWSNNSYYNQQQALGSNTISSLMGVMTAGQAIRAGKPCLVAESALKVEVKVNTANNGTYYDRAAVAWAYYKGVA